MNPSGPYVATTCVPNARCSGAAMCSPAANEKSSPGCGTRLSTGQVSTSSTTPRSHVEVTTTDRRGSANAPAARRRASPAGRAGADRGTTVTLVRPANRMFQDALVLLRERGIGIRGPARCVRDADLAREDPAQRGLGGVGVVGRNRLARAGARDDLGRRAASPDDEDRTTGGDVLEQLAGG